MYLAQAKTAKSGIKPLVANKNNTPISPRSHASVSLKAGSGGRWMLTLKGRQQAKRLVACKQTEEGGESIEVVKPLLEVSKLSQQARETST